MTQSMSSPSLGSPTSPGSRIQGRTPVLHLYDDPHSLYCAKVKVALYAKQLPFHSLPVPCGSTSSNEFAAVVPLKKIPALVVEYPGSHVMQQHVLMESEVINEFLEEEFPDLPLLPRDPIQRAQVRTISRFHDLYLEPALRTLYPHVSPAVRDDKVAAAVAATYRQLLGQLQLLLQPGSSYAVGEQLSLADCAYPAAFLYADMIFTVLGIEVDYRRWPRIASWRATLDRDPHVMRVLDELQPAAVDWLNGKLKQTGLPVSQSA